MEPFIGLERLKEKHYEQLLQFEMWAVQKNWLAFHQAHYDWWMFPIDQPSRGGVIYKIKQTHNFHIKKDKKYI
jgi:hypothetical protein